MSDDVLRTLREARPGELDPDVRVEEGVRSAELARAMATPRNAAGAEKAAPRRRLVRPAWGIGLVGAAAAAALVVATLPSGGDGGAAGPRSQAGGEPEQPGDARTVLLAAAEKLDGQTEGTGAYWHIATRSYSFYRVGNPAYTVVASDKDDGWTPGKPGGRSYGRQQSLGAKPATPADEKAWRRAGSPSEFEVKVGVTPGGGRYKSMKLRTAPGRQTVSSMPLVDGDKVFWLGRNVTMKDLRALPADPKRLKATLMRWYGGHDTEAESVPMSADAWLYRVGGNVVTSLPVSPKVRAAAFRMLAGLKSVEGIGKVRDAAGRTGDAIAMDEKTPRGVLRHRLVIDRANGNALADENVLLKPSGGESAPAGSLLNSTTVITMEWTNTVPR
ncbi:CU044_5270 family protein [Actinomadura litoris]|uniref:CU044_5270 family protein n=1 Tax=Actinomadura litoris TaxID=2678616 RepID=UPI001FA81673|nr:CU044_5270 family protein [Actinomadura litoris]